MLYTVYPLRGVSPVSPVERVQPVRKAGRVEAIRPVQSSPAFDTPPKSSKPVYLQGMQSLVSLRKSNRTEIDPDYIEKALARLGNTKRDADRDAMMGM